MIYRRIINKFPRNVLFSVVPVTGLVVLAQQVAVDVNSVVSVAVLIVMLGAVWTLSSTLTSLRKDIESLRAPVNEVPIRLTQMEGEITSVMGHVAALEGDINALFSAIRSIPGVEQINEGMIRRGRLSDHRKE